jgi:hypothetical protein
MGFAEHVALPHNTWSDPNRVDGTIELDVRSCHEHFVKTTTSVAMYAG